MNEKQLIRGAGVVVILGWGAFLGATASLMARNGDVVELCGLLLVSAAVVCGVVFLPVFLRGRSFRG